MSVTDSPTRYGWLSIGLHWAGAIAVVMLWFIGHVMTAERTAHSEFVELVRVHTSTAVAVYLLLVGRIVHRFVIGFPGPVVGQKPLSFVLMRLVQYVLLAGVAVMLVSGPLTVWSAGDSIGVFNWWEIPPPFGPNESLHALMLETHRTTRWVLLAAVLAHVGGVFLTRDALLNRMLVAPD